MKSSPPLCLALLLVLPLAAALWASPSPEPARPYLVIEGTISPNEQYAVAWALPHGPALDWEQFRRGERNSDYLPDLHDTAVADNLIELKSGRTLAPVASGYWALPEGKTAGADLKFRPDDEFLEVAWSAQSDFVVVLHRLRSGPEWGSLCALRLAHGAVVGQVEDGRELAAAARAHLQKTYRREYERQAGQPALRFADLKSLGGARFSLRVMVSLTNKVGNRSDKGSIIRLELRPDEKGKLALHVLGFSELNLDEAS